MSLLPSKFQEAAALPLGPPNRLLYVKPQLSAAPDWFATEPHEIDRATGKPCAADSRYAMVGKNDTLDAMLEHAVKQGWPSTAYDDKARREFLYGDFEPSVVVVSNEPRVDTYTLASGLRVSAEEFHMTAATDAEARDYTQRLIAGKVTVQEAEVMERRLKLRKRMREAQRGYAHY